MIEGHKDRRRQQAYDLLWLMAPHYQKNLPKLHEITGFVDDMPREKTVEERKNDFEELKSSLMGRG